MSNNDKSLVVQTDPDPVAIHVGSLVNNAKQWVDYAAGVISQGGDLSEVCEALEQIGYALVEVENHNALTKAIVPGLREALTTTIAQRDNLAVKYENVKATFDRQVHASVNDFAEHLFGCEGCYDDGEIENLANRMMEEGAEAVAEEARQHLERQLKEAQETAEEWQAESVTKPGIASGVTFQPNPNFQDSMWDQGDLDDDDDFDDEEEGDNDE